MTLTKEPRAEERAVTSPASATPAVLSEARGPGAPTSAPWSNDTAVSPGSVRRPRDITFLVHGVSPPGPPDSSPRSERGTSGMRYRFPTVERENYDIVGDVAIGGIGRVRRAREARLGRTVALKELLVEATPDAEARFIREALITARLQHPSIIPIYEAGRWPSGELFYAMKLVSGRSLAESLEGRGYEQRLELLPHVLAATEAIAYAHSRNILHRDLKPSNVLVGEFGETVVIDWGLAKDISEHRRLRTPGFLPSRGPDFDSYSRGEGGSDGDGETLTLAGSVIGTPAYMPPEQASGHPVDERADIYALGAILYHVLAGRTPYEGAYPAQLVCRVIAEPPVPLLQRQAGIARALVAIVEKAMARSPLDRYPTARELADDLRSFRIGQMVGAHGGSPRQQSRRVARRWWPTLMLVVAAIGVLVALGAVGVRRLLTSAAARAASTEKP
jgi:eukaryotic-like serine/threonine-protein kinase